MARKTEQKLFPRETFRGVYYAHRGLHRRDAGVPENSLAAFRAAAERGYGVELDVQLSRDGQVVVFHDDTLDRICGTGGCVWDFSLAELQRLSLLNTQETIPLFSEVLKTLEAGAGPLIVELKTGPRNEELCEKTLALLKTWPGVFSIESFDPRIVRWFCLHAPEIVRGQLAQPAKDYLPHLSRRTAWLLSGCRLSFWNRPDFIAYKLGPRPRRVLRKQKKGVLLIGWTSQNAPQDAPQNDGVIFENCLPPLRYNV